MNYHDKSLNLELPDENNKVLIHTCCAPCSASIILRLKQSGINQTVFFYNPNIYPQAEYLRRKKEVVRFVQKENIAFFDGDYNHDDWIQATNSFKNEPEQSRRCDICFNLRLIAAAKYAYENGFKIFTSSLGISRWKDFDQVTRAGLKAASLFDHLSYWIYNWRKSGGVNMMETVSKQNQFYRQKYCGCIYSINSKKQTSK